MGNLLPFGQPVRIKHKALPEETGWVTNCRQSFVVGHNWQYQIRTDHRLMSGYWLWGGYWFDEADTEPYPGPRIASCLNIIEPVIWPPAIGGTMTEFEQMLEAMLIEPDFSEAYEVVIEKPDNLQIGQHYWKCIFCHHLTPAENAGRNNVFVAAFDKDMNFVNVPVGWYWNGIGPEEKRPDLLWTGSKAWPKECANFALQGNFVNGVKLWIDGEIGEAIYGPSSRWGDERPGSTWGHHSFYAGFKKIKYTGPEDAPQPEPEPQPEPDPLPDDVLEALQLLAGQVQQAIETAQIKVQDAALVVAIAVDLAAQLQAKLDEVAHLGQ